jgi:hypothetical protein
MQHGKSPSSSKKEEKGNGERRRKFLDFSQHLPDDDPAFHCPLLPLSLPHSNTPHKSLSEQLNVQ